MEPSKLKILIVDDEELMRNLLAAFLTKFGFSYGLAVNGKDALEKLNQEKFDAVITDIKMPKMDGIILTGKISNQFPGLPVMVMTGFDDEYSAGTAISVGAREFIKKPFSISEFALRLQKMISDSETLKKLQIEKNKGEDVQDLMKELEAALKRK